MFSNAIKHMQSGDHSGPINEDDAVNAHQQVYGQSSSGGLNAGSIGAAGALQALKSFVGGQGTSTLVEYADFQVAARTITH